jgi:hypothetical protein|tara:strand:- start:46 stop:441 length:396 start_codon:yes stop_codon:yes gene_type:complete
MSFAGFGLQHKSEYQKTTVDIPRCNDCASLQAKAILAGFIVYGILIAIFFVQVILPMPNIEIDQKIIGLVLSVIFGSPILFLLNWIWGKFFHNKLRSEWDYPEVVELRKDGWAEGSEPIYKGADYDREKES